MDFDELLRRDWAERTKWTQDAIRRLRATSPTAQARVVAELRQLAQAAVSEFGDYVPNPRAPDYEPQEPIGVAIPRVCLAFATYVDSGDDRLPSSELRGTTERAIDLVSELLSNAAYNETKESDKKALAAAADLIHLVALKR